MSDILGIGNDIVEIERVHESMREHGDRFLERVYTPKEREYCLQYKNAVEHFAARFSVKEAIVKAFGVGIGEHVSWQDIEILNDEHGKPQAFFSDKLKKKFSNPKVLIAISHCRAYVSTVAIWVHS